MKLGSYQDVANAVYSGRRVVTQAVNHRHRIELGREVMMSTHNGWEKHPSNEGILRSGRGFLHIVCDLNDVRGMEYDDSFAVVDPEILSRVRCSKFMVGVDISDGVETHIEIVVKDGVIHVVDSYEIIDGNR
jgi:hypothetical protein